MDWKEEVNKMDGKGGGRRKEERFVVGLLRLSDWVASDTLFLPKPSSSILGPIG